MRAVVCERYGDPDVLRVQEVRKPQCGKKDVLIQIHTTSVSSGDARIRGLNVPKGMKLPFQLALGFKKPRNPILGSCFSGVVAAVGEQVSRFDIGDAVYGITGTRMRCYAEFIALPEKAVMVKKPDNVSHAQAVPIPFGAMTALHLLKKAQIRKGQRVLIYGASGSVGTYAVQLAKHMDAEVTAVCSERNFDWMRELGADHVMDYHKEDFRVGQAKYDVIFDAVWKIDKASCENVLGEKGAFVSVQMTTTETLDKLEYLNQLLKQGQLKTVIDRTYSLDDIVEAHRYVDTGHKKGNIIIQLPGVESSPLHT